MTGGLTGTGWTDILIMTQQVVKIAHSFAIQSIQEVARKMCSLAVGKTGSFGIDPIAADAERVTLTAKLFT